MSLHRDFVSLYFKIVLCCWFFLWLLSINYVKIDYIIKYEENIMVLELVEVLSLKKYLINKTFKHDLILFILLYLR